MNPCTEVKHYRQKSGRKYFNTGPLYTIVSGGDELLLNSEPLSKPSLNMYN